MFKSDEAFAAVMQIAARRVAEDLFEPGSELGYPTTRIAFKADGVVSGVERELGGLCLDGLIRHIRDSLEAAVREAVAKR